MRKLLTLIVVLSTLVAGCNKVDKDSFRISGKLTNGEEKQIYFFEMTGQGFKPLDTIEINKDGEYEFSYKLSDPTIYVLLDNQNDYITILPKKGEDIIMNGTFGSLSNSYTIKGSKESELLHKLNQEYIKTNSILAELKQTLHDNKYSTNIEEVKAQLYDKYNILEIHQKNIIKQFLSENKGSLVCIIALYRSFDNHYLFSLKDDLNVYEEVYNELSKKYPTNYHVIGLKNLINDAKLKAQQAPEQELANKDDKK